MYERCVSVYLLVLDIVSKVPTYRDIEVSIYRVESRFAVDPLASPFLFCLLILNQKNRHNLFVSTIRNRIDFAFRVSVSYRMEIDYRFYIPISVIYSCLYKWRFGL